jgi:hypothetical protein
VHPDYRTEGITSWPAWSAKGPWCAEWTATVTRATVGLLPVRARIGRPGTHLPGRLGRSEAPGPVLRLRTRVAPPCAPLGEDIARRREDAVPVEHEYTRCPTPLVKCFPLVQGHGCSLRPPSERAPHPGPERMPDDPPARRDVEVLRRTAPPRGAVRSGGDRVAVCRIGQFAATPPVLPTRTRRLTADSSSAGLVVASSSVSIVNTVSSPRTPWRAQSVSVHRAPPRYVCAPATAPRRSHDGVDVALPQRGARLPHRFDRLPAGQLANALVPQLA